MKNKNIHIAGIGGEGWSWIAKILIEQGNKVTGCNLEENQHIQFLKKLGLRDFKTGNSPEHITKDLDYFLYTSAILSNQENKKELDKAKELGIKALDRNEFLPLLLENRNVLAVAGTHGKTTTSAMVAYLLSTLGNDCGFGVGGTLKDFNINGRNGSTKEFVIEADEFADAFLGLHPFASIITNLEMDHHDYFKNFKDYKKSFEKFISQTQNFLVIFGDDRELLNLVKKSSKEYFTYGEEESNNYVLSNLEIKGLTTVWKLSGDFGTLNLEVNFPGKQYAYNATAAFILCFKLGHSVEKIAEALKNFQGTERRFEIKKVSKVILVNDYGHHPSEIKITLEGALKSNKKVVVIYEPHQYKRSFELKEQFKHLFEDLDYLIQTDIFASREVLPYPITSEEFFNICSSSVKNKIYVPDWKESVSQTVKIVNSIKDDHEIIVLVFAVGHGSKIVQSLLEKLK